MYTIQLDKFRLVINTVLFISFINNIQIKCTTDIYIYIYIDMACQPYPNCVGASHICMASAVNEIAALNIEIEIAGWNIYDDTRSV